MLEGAGLLDEGYFLYFEDVDYCRRAGRAGWRHAVVPEARALHLHGASTKLPALQARRARRPGYYYDARARYFTKFYGRGGLWLANVLWGLGRVVALVRERVGGRPPHAARPSGSTSGAEGLEPSRGSALRPV